MSKPFDYKEARDSFRAKEAEFLGELRGGTMTAREFTRAMSNITDGVVRQVADHYLKAQESQVSLVFSGGNGREEIYPGSDLDFILIVPESMSETLDPELERNFSSFQTTLWDMGFKTEPIVRTVKQCSQASLEDIINWSSLLDRRLAWGAVGPMQELDAEMTALNAAQWEEFIDQKLAETAKRHEKQSDSRYIVQPDIKEGKGGLRDFQSMMWIAEVAFSCETVSDLEEKGLISGPEAKRIQQAYDFLLEARCHLHTQNTSQKHNNILKAELQPVITKIMTDYTPDQRQEAVEDYMRRYFRHARDIGFLTSVVSAAALDKKAGFAAPVSRVEGFHIRGDKIHFDTDNPVPLEMMKIFRVAQQEHVEVHPDALRQIRRSLSKFDDKARKDPQNNKVFMEILTARENVADTLRKMQEVGILPKFLPPLDGLDMRMQFDPYQSYMADEHTFQSIGHLGTVEARGCEKEGELAGHLASELSDSERRVMAVALLLHDAGKDKVETGDEEEHPVRGAEMVREYGRRLGLEDREAERAAWLVENHLLLAHTALRRDLADPWTVETFAGKMGTERNLRLLTVLTTADIMGNSPESWERNAAVRIANLYHRTKGYMQGKSFEPSGEFKAEDGEIGTKINLKTDFMRNATVIDVVTPQTNRVFERLTGVLARSHANIVGLDFSANGDGTTAQSTVIVQAESNGSAFDEERHTGLRQAIEDALTEDKILDEKVPDASPYNSRKVVPYKLDPEVNLSNEDSTQSTLIEVIAPDRPSLLNNVARVFNEQGLEVKHARVSTLSRGFKAHDTFYVIDRETGAQVDSSRFEDIRQALLDSPALRAFEQ